MKIISSIILGGSLLLASSAFAAPSQSEQVYLMPKWFLHSEKPKLSAHSCLVGQADYKEELMRHALRLGNSQVPTISKTNYYALATYLGYFSDVPVEKDAIVEKARETIDKDFAVMVATIRKAHYILFVGDYGAHGTLFRNLSAQIVLPLWYTGITNEDKYDWSTNSFQVYSRYMDWRLQKKVYASSKEWQEKWEPLFASANKNLASRLLMDKDLHPLLAEIFDRKTGKTILSWVAEGMDVNKLQALVPDTPAADYDFNNCDSLNPDYYHKELLEGNTNGSSDDLKGFFGKLLGQ